VQRRHEAGVEIRNRHRLKRQHFGATVARLDAQPVFGKIENDIECTPTIGHRRRDEPAGGNVKGRVPPMIDQRCAGDTHLADDLRPQNQGVAAVAPGGIGQIGPLRRRAGGHVTFSRNEECL